MDTAHYLLKMCLINANIRNAQQVCDRQFIIVKMIYGVIENSIEYVWITIFVYLLQTKDRKTHFLS